MSNAVRKQVELYMEPDSPEMRERQRHLAKMLLRVDPELKQQLLGKAESKGRSEGLLLNARSALRRVLARRGLVVRPEHDARIDACADLALLERWLDEAIVAKTAADVFGAQAKRPRLTDKRKAR
jgi:hypothetical protein